jgi:hypothetical protein
MAIVKANYSTRGRNARKAAQTASRAAHYYTYRDGPDRDGRVWYASDGRSGPYDGFRAEIYAQAKAHAYTYRILLSTQAHDLGPVGYQAVLGERFAQYYFVEHHNTAYPHAHVIGYTNTKLSKSDLHVMRAQVKTLEQIHAQERTHATGSRNGSAEHEGHGHAHAAQMTAIELSLRRSRGQGLE